ncbi:DUF3742 family protein [Variovorax sp. LARHSF232]
MSTTTRLSTAERLCRWLGGMWRGGARLDRKATDWLLTRGLTPGVTKILLLAVKLAVLGVLLYTAFWLTLLLVFVMAAARMTARDDTEIESDFLGRRAEERDHREGIFYHPASYSDDPDPRFEDD